MALLPIQVVDHEILQNNKSASRGTMPLQIIKLAYLAHGWNLTVYKEPLFLEQVEAWKYGPVIPELYSEVKHFRDSPIDVNFFADNAKDVPASQKEIIDGVMGLYGELDGLHLSALTHQKGTPWDQTIQGSVISNILIKKHFDRIKADNE